MYLALEYASLCEQFLQNRQRNLHIAVHRAFDPGLLEQRTADCRVALDLLPLLRLSIDFTGQRQFAQVEVCTDVPEQLTLVIEDTLDGGQRRASSGDSDISGLCPDLRASICCALRHSSVWPKL